MSVNGSCLCGGFRFEVSRFEGPFELCHCTRCRKFSGSAFAGLIGVNREDFQLLSGRELMRSYEAPVRKHPPGYRSSFCVTCGSPLPNLEGDPAWFEIPAGLLDDSDELQPDRHIYVDCASTWYVIRDGLPQLSESELIRMRLANRE